MNQLKVFVSSTCYDLTQIRTDLFDCLSNFSYQPILSEYSSFPINPDNDTIENCVQNVMNADIFILIIGSRYGYVIDSGKSITNTEYLYAKRNGIPVYVFISKTILTLLPVWRKNKEVDFSDSVDSNKVFEFVEDLRNKNKNWCFEFEKAQDIIQTIKIQLSHLFKGALDIRKKFTTSNYPDYWKNLSSKAINIALKEGELFEMFFFLQVSKDELMKYESLKLDLDYHVLLGCNKFIYEPLELLNWFQEKLESINHFMKTGINLIREAYPFYYGEPGVPSDLKGLYYVASSMARLFKEMVLWSIDIKSTHVIDDFISIRDTYAKLIIVSAMNIWDYPDLVYKDLVEGIAASDGEPVHIKATIKFEIDPVNSDFLSLEMDKLVQKYGS